MLLVLGLLIAASNLGLVNRVVAMQNESGGNVLGLRDVLVALLIVHGLCNNIAPSSDRPSTLLHNPLARVSLAIVCLTCVAAAVGLYFGASPNDVALEAVTMLTWVLALFLGKCLQAPGRLVTLTRAIIAIGSLVSAGVLIEAASGGSIALVTPSVTALEQTLRSTPSGWPAMMMAFSCLMVLMLGDRQATLPRNLWRAAALGMLVLTSLLTQSRTLVVGMAFSSAAYLALGAVLARERIRWRYLGVAGGLCTVAALVALSFGSALWTLGSETRHAGFDTFFEHRFSVPSSDEEAEQLWQNEGRIEQLQTIVTDYLPKSPVLGFGLATSFGPDGLRFVDSIIGYFLLRHGLPGLLLWLWFVVLVGRSVVDSLRDASPLGLVGQALSVAMLNLVICATLSNVFACAYQVQQAIVGLGALIAYQQLKAREITSWHIRPMSS